MCAVRTAIDWWTIMPLPEDVLAALRLVQGDVRAAQNVCLDRVRQRRRQLVQDAKASKARVKLTTECAAGSSDPAEWAVALKAARFEDECVESEAETWAEWWWEYGQHGEAYLTKLAWLDSEYLQQLQRGMNFVELRDAIWDIKRRRRLAATCSLCASEVAGLWCSEHIWPEETPQIDEAVILALGQDPDYLSWAKDNPSPWDSKLD